MTEKKLVCIKKEVEKKFGHNEDGRGHWDEVEFMISLLLHYFPTKQNKNKTNCKRSTVAQLMNSNSNLELLSVYVLQYVRMFFWKGSFHVVTMVFFQSKSLCSDFKG